MIEACSPNRQSIIQESAGLKQDVDDLIYLDYNYIIYDH